MKFEIPDEKVMDYLDALPYSCIPNEGDVAGLLKFLIEEGWTPPEDVQVLENEKAGEVKK